jgi:hypothetical protein
MNGHRECNYGPLHKDDPRVRDAMDFFEFLGNTGVSIPMIDLEEVLRTHIGALYLQDIIGAGNTQQGSLAAKQNLTHPSNN